MLQLYTALLVKFISVLIGAFVALFALTYFLFTQDLSPQTLWFELFISYVVVFVLAFYIYKKIVQNIASDVNEIKEYLEDINAKKYDSPIKIAHYLEFLEIALLLKNLVKRVKNRDKGSKK